MEENICDSCMHKKKDCSEKPCNICMQWDIDGYLDATRYEPE